MFGDVLETKDPFLTRKACMVSSQHIGDFPKACMVSSQQIGDFPKALPMILAKREIFFIFRFKLSNAFEIIFGQALERKQSFLD